MINKYIQEIDSITQAQEALHTADISTLVVFDIDDTLIIRTLDAAPANIGFALWSNMQNFHPSDITFVKQFRTNFAQYAQSKNTHNPEIIYEKLSNSIIPHSHCIPVEPKTIELIQDLQNRTIKVVALTAAGSNKSIMACRVADIRQIGLDLSGSFEKKEIELDTCSPKLAQKPAFHHGILCATSVPKGQVLAAFFDKVDWTPNKVIFFDDCYPFCESVAQEMEKCGIPTTVYWYKADVLKNKIKLNQKIIREQLDYWMEHGEFSSEPVAP